MTKAEILAVTEQDTEACNTLNRMVHEKLGKCWHEWRVDGKMYEECKLCGDCHSLVPGPRPNPDYCHSIADAWAIKEWLDTHDSIERQLYEAYESLVYVHSNNSTLWASPLDRVKAFLTMEE